MTQDLADQLEKARDAIADARKAGAHWELIGDLRINLDRALFNNLDIILASLRRSAPASGEMGEAVLVEVLDMIRGCQHDMGFDRELGPLGCALEAEGRGGCVCAGIHAQITALRTPSGETREEAGG